MTLNNNEEVAFYEAGLSAHGCLENIDQYMKDCIVRYGRLLEERIQEDVNELKQQLDDLRHENSAQAAIIEQLKKEIQRK